MRTSSSQGNIIDTAKIQSGLYVYNYVTMDEAKTIAGRMYNGKSRLCSSYAWDTTLKYIDGETGTYSVNSAGDNYTGYIGGEKNTGYYGIKNIYDMGGNISEWTSELSTKSSYLGCYRRWILC